LNRHTPPVDAIVGLLVGQLVLGVGQLALLAFFVYKSRALMNSLAKSAAGDDWASKQMAAAFTSAAASIELSATANAASCVAIQTLARDLRPMQHTSGPASAD
jgi:hypothetical protein